MGHLDIGAVGGTVMVRQHDSDVLADCMSEWQTQNTRTLGYVFAAVDSFAASCNAHLQVAQGSIRDYHDFVQVVEESV